MYVYPKINSNEKIPLLFEKLRRATTPSKLTHRFLVKAGIKSSKDRLSIPLLKFLNYIDDKSVPTIHYSSLKDLTRFRYVLVELVQTAYADIFTLDPNAPFSQEEIVAGYFSSLTGESFEVCTDYARTFLNLCRLADFKKSKESTASGVKKSKEDADQENKKAEVQLNSKPNINISIKLPTTTDKQVYEVLFKHLKDLLSP